MEFVENLSGNSLHPKENVGAYLSGEGDEEVRQGRGTREHQDRDSSILRRLV
jgi:hypothetical protein